MFTSGFGMLLLMAKTWNALERLVIINIHDLSAVAIRKDGSVVGHVPRALSAVCSSFIRRGGLILCRVSGSRRYSADLPQGGLEVPCVLTFRTSNAKDVEKARWIY